MESFENSIIDKDFFSNWQKDGNINDFWKRNLSFLVNCRSLDDVIANKDIDEPIKFFMMRDIFGYTGKYIVLWEKRGEEEFCIGDAYPCCITCDNINFPIYDYYPISPNRIIVIVGNGVEQLPISIKKLSNSNLKRPVYINEHQIRIHVTKVYKDIVKLVNKDIIKYSKIGVAFKDENSISALSKVVE